MSLQLNDALIHFFSNIEIKFEYNDLFYIDFMDYFPLLKRGITTKEIYYNVMTAYCLKNKFIIIDDAINSNIVEILVRFYGTYTNKTSFCSTKDNIDDDLSEELILSQSLRSVINIYSTQFECNELSYLIYMCLPRQSNIEIDDHHHKILDKALKTTSIRLLGNVVSNNTEDMLTAFYIDEVDYYIGYMDLYQLAILRNSIKIANILKEMIMLKNWLIKQVLIDKFEELIGSSDIPNTIFKIIIK